MSTSSPVPKKILVVPLDWGLGHATRDIPLIAELLNAGCEVLIAAEGKHAALLAQEFPQLTILPLAGYNIRYAKKGVFFGLKIVQQIPKIYRAVANEKAWLHKTVKEHGIDAVISDNRFGLSHPDIPCVFISHQLLIKTPFGGITEKILKRINYFYIKKYSACWVPDFSGEPNLSGELAHPSELPANVTYLGCLSRFEKKQGVAQKYDLLVLISGPEPQRTQLEELIISQIKPLPVKALIVSGKPDQAFKKEIASGITHVSHLNAKELNDAMLASGLVLSRSGYTTLMDLAKLDKKAILVPTPGQTEQEYLGKWLMEKGYFYNVPQHEFDLTQALKASKNFPFRSFSQEQDMSAYKEVVRKFAASL
ncbi:glycosyltransferase [uncultured Chitinophaga sp.]|uniref:glycosyltransferase n=1 Tax=uncultured Chitinophaga sp. TaxID=339340 RepID=UPI0025CF38FE|nr:glycosyltransferase [uncultured Chitinophaga sp.]